MIMSSKHPQTNESNFRKAHLSSGAAAFLSAQATGIVVSILLFLTLPRVLGEHAWGVFVVWSSLWAVTAQLLESGGGIILHRFVPILRQEKPQRIMPLVRGLLMLKFVLLPIIWILGWYVFGGDKDSIISENIAGYTLVILAAFLYSWACLESSLHLIFKE